MSNPTPPARNLAWKIIQFPVARIIIASIFVIVPQLIVQSVFRPLREALGLSDSLVLDLLTYAIYAVVTYLAYRLYVRLIERRAAIEIGLRGAGLELGQGLLIGAVIFTVVIGLLWVFGVYHVLGVNNWLALLPLVGLMLSSGFSEELIFRGIVFRIAEESLGTWIALALSAVLFGLLHLGNPNATLTSAAAIAIEAGLMLAAAYMLTRRLWLATGLHAAWNFAQGGIFGVAVSGIQIQGLLQSRLDGPEWLSGGAFGAEASAAAVVVCLAIFVVLILAARKRGLIRTGFWQRLPAVAEPAGS